MDIANIPHKIKKYFPLTDSNALTNDHLFNILELYPSLCSEVYTLKLVNFPHDQLYKLNSLISLNKLICISTGIKMEYIINLTNIKYLRLVKCNDIKSIQNLPKLKLLKCVKCHLLDNITYLPELQQANIKNCNNFCSFQDIPKIEYLECSSCNSITNLNCCETKLRTLNCKKCKNLVNIMNSETLTEIICSKSRKLKKIHDVPNLELLVCNNCSLITSKSINNLPKLLCLYCKKCDGITSIDKLTQLQYIDCSNCKNIVNVKLLKTLKYANINKCSKETNFNDKLNNRSEYLRLGYILGKIKYDCSN